MKKLFIYFLCLCCFFNTFLIVGCNNNTDIDSCKHKYYCTHISESTCKEKGLARYTCSKCQYTYYADLKLADHTYKSSKVEATCTKEGYTLFECTVCGKIHKNNIIPANGNHNHVETGRENSTCNKKGYIQYTCERCGDSYKQTLELSEHNYHEVNINGEKIICCSYCWKEK